VTSEQVRTATRKRTDDDLDGGILLIAPRIPPYGGVALQARYLESLMKADGVPGKLLPSNPPLPRSLRFCERVPGLRTVIRCAVFCASLGQSLRGATVVHIFACSWIYFFAVVSPAVLMACWMKKRIVLNYRGGEAALFFRSWGWLAAPVFSRATVVTAPSRYLAEIIERRFHIPVEIVPNLVDLSRFQFRQRDRFEPKIALARHLEAIYDVESALKAFREIQKRYPEATLQIAGAGSQREYLSALAAEWQLSGVRFLGQVDQSQLPLLYEECDIFLNASLVDNFPGALIEASAAGLAVVTSGAGGIPFIYENGRTALLAAPGDWQGLAAAVIDVIEQPSRAAAMTRSAAQMTQGCAWASVKKSLFRVYGITGRDQCAGAHAMSGVGEV